ncbi:hypothetical protein Fmac_005610 [Flemingia macrophylla]|uniref:F-box domain-containing protein n=1 Tax=Flemingia macrophylla TaxID=520843 RepID=A0ABD1N881_9FABA
MASTERPHAPPSLPMEVIGEILERLPVKHLLRLRCVCKSWKALVSDPGFAKNQVRRSPTATRLIANTTTRPPLCDNAVSLRAFRLRSLFNDGTFVASELNPPLPNPRGKPHQIVASCDGIICFRVLENPNFLVLWNPTIAKFKALPPLAEHTLGDMRFGFGYDSSSRTYKLVWVLSSRRRQTQANVFALGNGTDTWTTIRGFPSSHLYRDSGKFVSGSLNWLTSGASSSRVIVSLDLRNESCGEVPQPDYGGVVLVNLTLCVLRDCLSLQAFSHTFVDVWLMREYGSKESWSHLFRLSFQVPNFKNTKVLFICEDGQVLLLHRFGRLIVYNPVNATFKIIKDIAYCESSQIGRSPYYGSGWTTSVVSVVWQFFVWYIIAVSGH